MSTPAGKPASSMAVHDQRKLFPPRIAVRMDSTSVTAVMTGA